MSEITERGYHKPEVLVSTQWVEDHLNDPNIRIIESNEDALLYASGHIPGAYSSASSFDSMMRMFGSFR